MSAFFLCKKEILTNYSIQETLNTFQDRGFSEPVLLSKGAFDCYIYPKLNGAAPDYFMDDEGNYVVIAGTLLYASYKVNDAKKILQELKQNTFKSINAKGAFAILYYNASLDTLELIQDEISLFRVYQAVDGNVITTSFLSALAFSKKSLSTNALIFNLITGYQTGRNTWVNDVFRILSGDSLSEKIRSRKHPKADNQNKKTDTSALLLSRLKSIECAGVDEYYLGLSAGYDSRLMLSILNENKLRGLKLFTFYKENDPDLIYSQQLAKETQIPIDIVKTQKGVSSQESVYKKCYLFFDGGVHSMMQYSKEEYSRDFRQNLFSSRNMLQVSGVGGEIYRNYDHDPTSKMSINSWIISLILSPWLWQTIHEDHKREILSFIRNFLKENLNLQTDQVDFLTRKKYYAEVFVRDWHSLRNSTENQFAYYISPFIDRTQINASYDHVNEHGYGGKYEASLIRSINPALAKIPNNYGYSFDHYNKKQFLKDYIWSQSNRPQSAYLKGMYSSKRLSKASTRLSDFESDLLNTLHKMNLPLDITNLMKRGDTREQLLSTAYSLSQLSLI